MAMRLHEIHPVTAHFPITLVPLSIASDVVGSMTDLPLARGMGRVSMSLALASMAVTAVTGVVAQEGVTAVRTPGVAQNMLITHRNLNMLIFGAAAGVTAMRMRQTRPNAMYYLCAAGVFGAMTYSAYLGGEMVHKRGVGVLSAGGVQPDRAPELRMKNAGAIVGTIFGNLSSGLARAARGWLRGPRMPALRAEDRLMREVEGVPREDSPRLDDSQGEAGAFDADAARFPGEELGGLH